jgi:hypothetical protein
LSKATFTKSQPEAINHQDETDSSARFFIVKSTVKRTGEKQSTTSTIIHSDSTKQIQSQYRHRQIIPFISTKVPREVIESEEDCKTHERKTVNNI